MLSVSLSGYINYLEPSSPSKPARILKGHNKPITKVFSQNLKYFHIYPGLYIFCKILWWGGGGEELPAVPAGQINGFRGKNEEGGGGEGEKIRQKREEPPKNFPPSGCKIDFSAGGGGGLT